MEMVEEVVTGDVNFNQSPVILALRDLAALDGPRQAPYVT